MKSRQLLDMAAAAVLDKQGRDVLAFDVRAFSGVADYHLLVSAVATPHIKALYNAVRLALKDGGALCYRKAGTPESGWMVADYLDVVIHYFDQDTRRRYNLEELWGQAPRVEF